MPPPRAIIDMGRSAQACGSHRITFNNPKSHGGKRVRLTRTYHGYLELTMQTKHDQLLVGKCRELGVATRRRDGTQIRHGIAVNSADKALSGFYVECAEIAADAVSEQMVQRWRDNRSFTAGDRVDAGVQSATQSDGLQYEISYWYDKADTYVLFHCYPGR